MYFPARHFIALVLCTAAAAACAKQGAADNVRAAGTWETRADLPYRVQEIYPAVHQGKIWVAGGLSPDVPVAQQNVSDRVVIYDPATNLWTDGPALPEPRHHPILVSTGDALWAFGGFVVANGGRWSNSRDVLRLADGAAQWQHVAELPQPLSETTAAFIDGVIYLATGRSPSGDDNADWGDQADTAISLRFDPETREFTRGLTAPQALNSAAAAVVDGKLLIAGGRTVQGGNRADLQIYDPVATRWTTGPKMPQAQGGLAAAALGQKLYVFGGEYFNNGGGVYAQSWVYDTEAESWHALPDMPVPRHGLGAVALGGSIYVIAGATRAGGSGTSARLSRFTPAASSD